MLRLALALRARMLELEMDAADSSAHDLRHPLRSAEQTTQIVYVAIC